MLGRKQQSGPHDRQIGGSSTGTRLLPQVSPAPRGAANEPAGAPSSSQHSAGQSQSGAAGMDPEGDAVVLWWQGRRTAVTRDHNGLQLEQLPDTGCLSWCTGPASVKYVPYSEILCCRYLPIRRYCSGLSPCQRKQRHYMELQVLSRHPARPWLWGLKRLELSGEHADTVKAWVQQTRQQLRALPYRPQRLLVFVNPFGGKRQARRTWTQLAEPILTSAGVACSLVETQYQGHAEELVRDLSLEQLQELDGIVAVGGDGLFAELLTAVLQHKHLAAALQLRLGHIPAGSTDAVVCTLHGTRDAVTAALHVALGDCTALDVGRMVTLPPADTQQQQAAGTAAGQDASSAALPASKQQQEENAARHSAAFWDAGLSAGSHSELLLGTAAAVTSSSNGVAGALQPSGTVSAAANGASAGGSSSSSSSVPDSRKQRRQQRRQQQREQQKQQQQKQQQQEVRLHIPQLRHFVCVANYGFLGDVMETSERLRFCGPMRYDIAGVLRFLMLRQYKATIWYKPAPLHGSSAVATGAIAAAAVPAAQQQQQQHKKDRKQRRPAGPDMLVSPAAVSPLPHHRAPALHARMSISGIRLPWWQQQQQQEQQQQCEHAPEQLQQEEALQRQCCEHGLSSHLLNVGSHCSSESSSRRSSMDFSSAPLNTVLEGLVVGDAIHAAAPAVALADAGAAGSAGGVGVEAGAADSSAKQQQQGKSVSFLPQLTAAVHASAASFSSKASSISAGGIAAVLGASPSRASSVTSQQSSRCHSRCSRCSAAAMHRSTSRQTFAALTGAAAAGEAAAGAPPAAAAGRPSGGGSHPSSPGRGSDTADGIVQVTPLPATPAAGSSTAAAAAAQTQAAAACAAATAAGTGGPPGPGWVKLEGQYASIMTVVTSCISDKSRQGLMPEAHLADGRLALVMVEGCSRLQYLRFLIQLASKGIVPGSLPFVKVEYATEVQVESEGSPSSWNVDGELLRHGRVNVGIHAGLVDVFARGVELM